MKHMVAATTRSGKDELDPVRTSPDPSGHHQIRRGRAQIWRAGAVAGISGGVWMGSVGPLMGSPGLSTGFPFFVFYSI
jgi:hypothetical protein